MLGFSGVLKTWDWEGIAWELGKNPPCPLIQLLFEKTNGFQKLESLKGKNCTTSCHGFSGAFQRKFRWPRNLAAELSNTFCTSTLCRAVGPNPPGGPWLNVFLSHTPPEVIATFGLKAMMHWVMMWFDAPKAARKKKRLPTKLGHLQGQ